MVVRKFWAVMRIDAPGPRETTGGQYFRHATQDDAVREARRLALSCPGARFAVMAMVHVVGFIDCETIGDGEIPF